MGIVVYVDLQHRNGVVKKSNDALDLASKVYGIRKECCFFSLSVVDLLTMLRAVISSRGSVKLFMEDGFS